MREGVYGLKCIFEERCVETMPSEILEIFISDLESKHVALIDSESAYKIYKLSTEGGYENTILGSHRQATILDEYRRIIAMQNNRNFKRPVRIVKDLSGRYWCDNTHAAIAYILRGNKKINEIPFYVVDLKDNSIISCDGAVNGDLQDLRNIISSSLRIQERIDKGIRPIDCRWTIENLMKNLKVI